MSPRVSKSPPTAELAAVFSDMHAEGGLRRVLDVGCGSAPAVAIPADVHLIGIDVDERAVTENESLNERIVGDVQRYPLPPDSMDAVLCWNVLEHLAEPERAIENIAR